MLPSLETLEDWIRWSLEQPPPTPRISNIIEQDEYTLDVIVDLANGHFAVLDTT